MTRISAMKNAMPPTVAPAMIPTDELDELDELALSSEVEVSATVSDTLLVDVAVVDFVLRVVLNVVAVVPDSDVCAVLVVTEMGVVAPEDDNDVLFELEPVEEDVLEAEFDVVVVVLVVVNVVVDFVVVVVVVVVAIVVVLVVVVSGAKTTANVQARENELPSNVIDAAQLTKMGALETATTEPLVTLQAGVNMAKLKLHGSLIVGIGRFKTAVVPVTYCVTTAGHISVGFRLRSTAMTRMSL